MTSTLGAFLDRLEASGELHRVAAPVSPILEIAEIADRQSKEPCPRVSEHARRFDPGHCDRGGRAILFERVEGCDLPLCINTFGSYRRTEMALGCERGGFEALAERIGALARPQPPRSFGELVAMGRRLLPLVRTPPRRLRPRGRGRRGPCQEISHLASEGGVDLRRLPLIQCWPLDGDLASVGWDLSAAEAGRPAGCAEHIGRYVTFAGMHTVHADDAAAARPGSHNIGMYRAQLLDATHLVMHWHIHHDGAAHWRSWKALGRPMPIAICFGAEPVMPYAATAPLPPGLSELLMAGFLNGRGIPMVRGRTVPLWVPANSEVVIEGFVDTTCGPIGWEPRRGGDGRLHDALGPGAVAEGPFGDHTGFYSLPDRYPIVEVTAVTHRRGAVFPATIVGPPPQEDYYLGKATERIFRPLLQVLVPDLVDYHLPMFGCFHNCAFLKIHKAYALQGRRIMHSVWGAGQMSWTKLVIVVDGDVDVHDEQAVLAMIFDRCDFATDLEAVSGPLDILDHAATRLGAGGKLGIDATRRFPGEPLAEAPPRPGPGAPPRSTQGAAERLAGTLAGRAGIKAAAAPGFGRGRCVFVSVDKRGPGAGARAIEAALEAADFVVAVDARVDPRDWQQVLFHCCANVDPGRDLVRRGGRIGFDATAKVPGDERNGFAVRPYPPPIEMDAATKQCVSERWREYGF